MDQLIFASLSHTHYWYEVGMLKVPAVRSVYSIYTVEVALILFGSAYLQSMDFQREPQSKHHLYFLDCFFLPLGQPDPTRPISLTLTQTPTPADRVVPIHSSRPLDDSTVWADFVCDSGSVLYLVRTQSKK